MKKSWIERELDYHKEYDAEISGWQDFKCIVLPFLIPLLILGSVAVFVLGLVLL